MLQCKNSLVKFYSDRTQEIINQSIFFKYIGGNSRELRKKLQQSREVSVTGLGCCLMAHLAFWLVEARESANIAKRSYLLVTRMPSWAQRWARDGFKGDEDPWR